jgi:hypothetical protein
MEARPTLDGTARDPTEVLLVSSGQRGETEAGMMVDFFPVDPDSKVTLRTIFSNHQRKAKP